MQRRKFLQQLGYSLPAAFTLPTLLSSCKNGNDDEGGITSVKKFKDYTVVIIGAGAAGLYTGWYLQERGFNVKVLEASDSVGGRVRTLSGFADFDIELGAEEIHGNNSEWYRIVTEQVKAKLNDVDKEDFYFFKQNQGDSNEPTLKSETLSGQYEDYTKAIQFVEDASNYAGPDVSVENFYYASGLPGNLFGVTNALLGNEYGTSNNKLSIKGVAEEDSQWTAGDDSYSLKNQTLLSVMETKFGAILPKVQLNTQVKKIDYIGSKITITDQNNKTYEADRVVLTVPLPVLRDGDIAFTPALPSTKIDAIANIGMGSGMKAIFKFSNAFWENITTDTLGDVIGYTELPVIWATSVGRGTTPTITAFVMGDKADQYSSMSVADAKGVMLANLDVIFGNNIASQSLLQDGFHLMDWGKAPFIRGSYSYPKVGGGLIFRKELAADVDGRIFFAGEATHFKGHSATVHGAIETGIRAVEEIEMSIP